MATPPPPPGPPGPPPPPPPPPMGFKPQKQAALVIPKKVPVPLPQELSDGAVALKDRIANARGVTAADIQDVDPEFSAEMLKAIDGYVESKIIEYKKIIHSLDTKCTKEMMDDPLAPLASQIPLLTITHSPGMPTVLTKFQDTMEAKLKELARKHENLVLLQKSAEEEAELLKDPNDPVLTKQLADAITQAQEAVNIFDFKTKEAQLIAAIEAADIREKNVKVMKGAEEYTRKKITDMKKELENASSRWKLAYKGKVQVQAKAQVVNKDEFPDDSEFAKFEEFRATNSYQDAVKQQGKYTKVELLKLAMKLLPEKDLVGNTTDGKIVEVKNMLKSCIGLLAPKQLPVLRGRLQAEHPELNIGPGATVKQIVAAALGYDIVTKHEERLEKIKEDEIKAKEEAARKAAEAVKQQAANNVVGLGAAAAAGIIPQVGTIQKSAVELEAEAKAREAHAKEMEAQAKLLELQQAEVRAREAAIAREQAEAYARAQTAQQGSVQSTAALKRRGKG